MPQASSPVCGCKVAAGDEHKHEDEQYGSTSKAQLARTNLGLPAGAQQPANIKQVRCLQEDIWVKVLMTQSTYLMPSKAPPARPSWLGPILASL
jgi:hypothetical protein